MSHSVRKLMEKFYKYEDHPYRIFTSIIRQHLEKGDVVVDIGCGREAPELSRMNPSVNKLIGIDLEDFNVTNVSGDIHLVKNSADDICIRENTVDLVISRSVIEHLRYPLKVYDEVSRILKKDGHFIFLTPNIADYATVISMLIPNCLHPFIVSKTEGRDDHDTFPAYYRANSIFSIKKHAGKVGFEIKYFKYLGQYPAYLTFNPIAFLLGTIYDKLVCKYDSLKIFRGWILVVLKK